MDRDKLKKAASYQGEGFGERSDDVENRQLGMIVEVVKEVLLATFDKMQKEGEGLTWSQKQAILKGIEL